MVAEAQEHGISKAAQPLFEQVGAGWLGCAERPQPMRQHPATSAARLAHMVLLLPPLQVVPVPRGLWDDSTGFVKLTAYATADARAALEAGMLQSLAGGYLAHAAAGALLRWRKGGCCTAFLLSTAKHMLPSMFALAQCLALPGCTLAWGCPPSFRPPLPPLPACSPGHCLTRPYPLPPRATGTWSSQTAG